MLILIDKFKIHTINQNQKHLTILKKKVSMKKNAPKAKPYEGSFNTRAQFFFIERLLTLY